MKVRCFEMSIGRNIFKLRRQKKMTQVQLAEKLGVTEQSVSKWENDICAPDISQFPALARLFEVSIDRIFGYHFESYDKEVESIIEASNGIEDIYRSIEILSEGLGRYPNSDKLKLELAYTLSMVNRISEDEAERKKATDKAIGLCGEIIGTSGNTESIDGACNLLYRIYNDMGEYDKAMAFLDKLSPAKYDMRITGMAYALAGKKDVDGLLKYAQKELIRCWLTMTHLLRGLTSGLCLTSGEYEKALKYHRLHRRLLEIFDDECKNAYATYKLWECEQAAQIYMKLGDKKRCMSELERLLALWHDVREVAKSKSFKIADRNPYFTELQDENLFEEYLASPLDRDFIIQMLQKYTELLGGDDDFITLQKEAAIQ